MPKIHITQNKKISLVYKLIIVLLGLSLITSIAQSVSPGLRRNIRLLSYHVQNLGPTQKNVNVRLHVPYHRQEHSLSCEIAALKMALNFYGVDISESDLLKDLPFVIHQPRGKDNIWGDPNQGFVGDIDGTQPNTGYGVYEKPLAELAGKYRDAQALSGAELEDVLSEVAQNHPVIVWGSLSSGKDISWTTHDGKTIKAIQGEHTRVIIGFKGTTLQPKSIILLDPIYGTISMSKEKFLKDWRLLENKAVIVY